MQANVNELIGTLEGLTREARLECDADMDRVRELIEARRIGIVELAEFAKNHPVLTPTDLLRIRDIEREGAEVLKGIRETRDDLRENLQIGGRQESFSKCMSGILNLSESAE
jgi:hypothetical protein